MTQQEQRVRAWLAHTTIRDKRLRFNGTLCDLADAFNYFRPDRRDLLERFLHQFRHNARFNDVCRNFFNNDLDNESNV
jgi:hypothetical protein